MLTAMRHSGRDQAKTLAANIALICEYIAHGNLSLQNSARASATIDNLRGAK